MARGDAKRFRELRWRRWELEAQVACGILTLPAHFIEPCLKLGLSDEHFERRDTHIMFAVCRELGSAGQAAVLERVRQLLRERNMWWEEAPASNRGESWSEAALQSAAGGPPPFTTISRQVLELIELAKQIDNRRANLLWMVRQLGFSNSLAPEFQMPAVRNVECPKSNDESMTDEPMTNPEERLSLSETLTHFLSAASHPGDGVSPDRS